MSHLCNYPCPSGQECHRKTNNRGYCYQHTERRPNWRERLARRMRRVIAESSNDHEESEMARAVAASMNDVRSEPPNSQQKKRCFLCRTKTARQATCRHVTCGSCAEMHSDPADGQYHCVLCAIQAKEQEDLHECTVCNERNVRILTACGHAFCVECRDTWKKQGKVSCPICRQKLG